MCSTNQLGDSPVDGVEAERHALQDKDFSDAAFRTILTATRDTSRKVYNSRWENFSSWCDGSCQNPISTSVKHVLDFLQLKSETLAMNTLKGYVTAISHRHTMVHGVSLGLDPSIQRWINGLEHTKGIPRMIMPMLCLELVPAPLTKVPFKPIETCHLKYLTWKKVFLLAVTSGHRDSELQVAAHTVHQY